GNTEEHYAYRSAFGRTQRPGCSSATESPRTGSCVNSSWLPPTADWPNHVNRPYGHNKKPYLARQQAPEPYPCSPGLPGSASVLYRSWRGSNNLPLPSACGRPATGCMSARNPRNAAYGSSRGPRVQAPPGLHRPAPPIVYLWQPPPYNVSI